MPPPDRKLETPPPGVAAKAEETQRVTPGEEPTFNVMEVIKQLRKGKSVSELQQGLQDLVLAVRDTKRKGRILLEIGVECRTVGQSHSLEISDDIKLYLPKPLREKTTMFSTRKGSLHREDPRQGSLPGMSDEDDD